MNFAEAEEGMQQFGAFQRWRVMATSGDMSGINGGLSVVFVSGGIFCQLLVQTPGLDDLLERYSI